MFDFKAAHSGGFFLIIFAAAMQKTDKYRIVISRFLLIAFLLLQVVAALHTHKEHTELSHCMECVKHVPHPGHITVGDHQLDDCVICQLLAAPYLQPGAACVQTPTDASALNICPDCHQWGFCAPASIRLRAPPTSLSLS